MREVESLIDVVIAALPLAFNNTRGCDSIYIEIGLIHMLSVWKRTAKFNLIIPMWTSEFNVIFDLRPAETCADQMGKQWKIVSICLPTTGKIIYIYFK